MPDSMYDKLGELLSEAIESGNFFDQNKKTSESQKNNNESSNTSQKATESTVFNDENTSDSIKKYTQNGKKDRKTENHYTNNSKTTQNKGDTVYKNIHLNNTSQSCIVPDNQKLIKYAHPEVQKACTFVGVTDNMSFEDAKKQYHKKLLRFHPDKNADNELMRKITREKTAQLVEAWQIIEKWYQN